MSVASPAVRADWNMIPFGRLTARSREANQPDLQALSVFLDQGVVPRSSREDNHNRLGSDLSNYLVVRPGDMVFNKLRTWQGGLGHSKYEGVVSPAYFVCRPQLESDLRFYHYLLRSSPYLAELTRLSKFMPPSQFDIAWDDLKTLDVPRPGVSEQRAIADYLDAETARIDALIAKKQQLIHLLEERWRAVRNYSILKGLVPVDGSGSFVDEWQYPKLGVLIELQRGHDLPSDERRPGEVPIVSSGGVSGYHDTAAVSGPGVVTGRYGTIGEVFFVEDDYWPLNTTLYVKDFRGNDPRWVAFLLESLPLDAESEKSAVGGINRNVIGNLRVPQPPIETQVATAEQLSGMLADAQRTSEATNHQIDLLAERRQALITAAVTGEFKVPGAA